MRAQCAGFRHFPGPLGIVASLITKVASRPRRASYINAETEDRDPLSILNFYKRCLALRKRSKTLLWGTYREYFRGSSRIYMYERKYEDKDRGCEERILVICSFSTQELRYPAPRGYNMTKGKLILDNYISGTLPTSKPSS